MFGSSTNSPKIANKIPKPVKKPVKNNEIIVIFYPKKQIKSPILINIILINIVDFSKSFHIEANYKLGHEYGLYPVITYKLSSDVTFIKANGDYSVGSQIIINSTE